MEMLNGSDLYRPPITTKQHCETIHKLDDMSNSVSNLSAGHASTVVGNVQLNRFGIKIPPN